MTELATTRRTVHYSGRVQGVGFRATVAHLAVGAGLEGYVKNLPDGRVELVAEGRKEAVDRLTESVQREMARYIAEAHVSDSAPAGDLGPFRISY